MPARRNGRLVVEEVEPVEVPHDLRPRTDASQLEEVSRRWPELHRFGARTPLSVYLRRVWERREFVALVPMGQVAARTQDTVLGRAWNLLNPLLLVGIYYFIFQVVLGIEERGGIEDYLPFLTVGVITFNFSRASIHGGAGAVVRNRGLVQSLYFPRAILPLSALIAEIIGHAYALGAMLVLLLLMGVDPSPTWALLPFVLVLQVLLNLGLGMFAARFSFHFADFEKLLPYLLRVAFYASGVLFPVTADLIEDQLTRTILTANPLFLVVDLSRQVLLGDTSNPEYWLYLAAWVVILLPAGFWYFRRAEASYGRL